MSQLNKEKCSEAVYKNGISVALLDIPRAAAESLCEQATAALGFPVDWHYIAGRVHVKALKPAEQPQDEPFYQLRNTAVGNTWRDADKAAYDSAAKLAEYERRILYTHADPAKVEGKLNEQRAEFAKASQIEHAKWSAEVERLRALSVTNILMAITPGYDGMGQEHYAKTVGEVEQKLSELSIEVDDLRAQATQHKLAMDAACAEIAEAHALLGRVMTGWKFQLTSVLRDDIDAALSASAEPSDYLKSCEAVAEALSEPADGSPKV